MPQQSIGLTGNLEKKERDCDERQGFALVVWLYA